MANIEKRGAFDVAVIGGGPAGIMASIWAAKSGAKTVLIEKNETLGRKLLLTGGGRCNFANNERDLRHLIINYGKNGSFLFHSLSKFGSEGIIHFFNGLGVETTVENNGRIFPKSGLAGDILEALERALKSDNVNIIYGRSVIGIDKEDNIIRGLKMDNGEIIIAKNYIIATGGKSYPITGSVGDGYNWAQNLGHHIEKLRPALVPLKVKEQWVQGLSGVSLKYAAITVFLNGKKIFADEGEILFTHFGLSGPAILAISLRVGELLENGNVSLGINLLQESNFDALDKELQARFSKNPNRQAANLISGIIPQSIAAEICVITGIDPKITVNNITREERHRLVRNILDLRLGVGGLLNIEAGMVTGGGISLEEIDHKTMRSKIIKNLFFAGEIINVHGRTGGYNLLQCWSTGRLAGISAAG